MKYGARISRKHWSSPAFVVYMPAQRIAPERINERTLKHLPDSARSQPLFIGGYFAIYSMRGTWQPGWAPTQFDLIADDWEIAQYCDPPTDAQLGLAP